MFVEITIPKIGYFTEEVQIEKWLKKEGDEVKAGEAILEISADKASMEIEAPAEGILLEIFAEEGSSVRVMQVVGHIRKR